MIAIQQLTNGHWRTISTHQTMAEAKRQLKALRKQGFTSIHIIETSN